MKIEKKSLLEKFNDFKVKNITKIKGGAVYYDNQGDSYDVSDLKTVIDCIDDLCDD